MLACKYLTSIDSSYAIEKYKVLQALCISPL